MTCRDTLKCIHEPFGDAFYYGPERLSSRFEEDEKARVTTGFSKSAYKTILDSFEKEGGEVRITPSPAILSQARPFFVAQPCKPMRSFHAELDRYHLNSCREAL